MCVFVCVSDLRPGLLKWKLRVLPSVKWFLTRVIILDESDSGDLQWSLDILTSKLCCSTVILLQYQTVSFSWLREKYKQFWSFYLGSQVVPMLIDFWQQISPKLGSPFCIELLAKLKANPSVDRVSICLQGFSLLCCLHFGPGASCLWTARPWDPQAVGSSWRARKERSRLS